MTPRWMGDFVPASRLLMPCECGDDLHAHLDGGRCQEPGCTCDQFVPLDPDEDWQPSMDDDE